MVSPMIGKRGAAICIAQPPRETARVDRIVLDFADALACYGNTDTSANDRDIALMGRMS